MFKDCKHCQTSLTLAQQHYHQYLCPSQQFMKQIAQLEFLLSNSKISSQQFQQIKEILKQNIKIVYQEDILNKNRIFNDSIEKQECPDDDIFFLNSNISNYFENKINNQLSNLQENVNTQNDTFFESHSEFFDYIQKVDKQIDERSVVVKKEMFNMSELLQNLQFNEQYPTNLSNVNQNDYYKNKNKCFRCCKIFNNSKTLNQHIKNVHKPRTKISKKNRQKYKKQSQVMLFEQYKNINY
ncbi:unnamed protein product [Paramecium sonneborni]|uniref:C2H2-type domain-containing protein n=1 Tax=Paramecium sonneborni TaxID=65129 RepID=A0A8S1KCJ4_9CILI|nr:unnamed protein product [Paramecium sonneborni]